MSKLIFSLDIGTRSVTGIILEESNDQQYKVIDYYSKEHKQRAMIDGQIHDIISVSDIINDVKNKLEETYGSLNQVSVAAAGRALKTVQASASLSIKQQPIIEEQTIKHLELSAVQAAQDKLSTKNNNDNHSNYYCVGYSVLHYELDNEKIGSFIDQNGDNATVHIIATFLPKVVVESLLATLERSNLVMEALTLEPIAAIQVLIPESMRRLNVALVDIGAGTSDIAVTNDGTVTAYGMVATAGDEITEAICDHYLLDFPVAEQMKRNVVTNGEDVVNDILGFETTVMMEDLMNVVEDSVDNLAHSLAEEILRLNDKSPRAIMLIGGGSLTPKIPEKLAQKLQLPNNRVAVRGIDAIQNLEIDEQLPDGPDFVTPIGIAIVTRQDPVHYISVHVNDQSVRMFQMKKLTVGDCLVQAGIDINKWYGKPGLAAIVSINNDDVTLPGYLGDPPSIFLNNEYCTVESEVINGDTISITKGKDGNNPYIKLDQLLDVRDTLSIQFDGKPYTLKPKIYVNDELKQLNYIVKDKDKIIINQPRTIDDLLLLEHIDDKSIRPFSIKLNEQIIEIRRSQVAFYLNNKRISKDYRFKDGDCIKVIKSEQPTVNDLLLQINKSTTMEIEVLFNGQSIRMKQPKLSIKRKSEVLTVDSKLHPNDQITIIESNTIDFIFQDVFRYIDLDLSNVKGHFTLYKNNLPTTFYEKIQHGDDLSIKWEVEKSVK